MDADDPWGEEPDWARDDDNGGSGMDGGDVADKRDETIFGAQHVLCLIDCRPSMFVPCIPFVGVKQEDDDNDKKQAATTTSSSMISPFDAALMACEKLLRLRVHHVATSKTGKRDGVGIMLYGTKQRPVEIEDAPKEGNDNEGSDNEDNKEEDSDTDDEDDGDNSSPLTSTHTLLPIAPPGIQEIRNIRACLLDQDRGTPRTRNLEKEYADVDEKTQPSQVAQKMGHTTLCPLRTALVEAMKAFVHAKCVKKQAATSKTPADAKTIWIFTNEDDPCHGNEEETKLVIMVAKDAVENSMEIQVWPLPGGTTASPFSREVFFHNITTRGDDQEFTVSQSIITGAFDLEDMLEDVARQWKKVRKAFCLPLLLPDWRDRPDDPGIMMDFYNVVQIRGKPQPVTIHQQTNKMTEKTTQLVTKDTGEVIVGPRNSRRSKSEGESDSQRQGLDRIRTFAEFGDERVPLSKDEQALIKQQSNATDKPSLILLGFKPINAIPLTHRIGRPYFAYPDEEMVKGSKMAFAHLHAAMMRKGVLAIGELLTKSTATSRLVAMYPQQEQRELVDEEDNNEVEKQTVPPGFIVVNLPYEDDMREVDAGVGASEESVEAAMELIQHQKLDGIEFGYSFENAALARFWNYIESVALGQKESPVEDDTELDHDAVLLAAGPQIDAFRSRLPEDIVEAKTKKRKIEPDDSGYDWVDLYKRDELSDCNVAMLKKYLRSVGERLGGRKAELVLRVSQHIEQELLKTANEKPSVKVEEC